MLNKLFFRNWLFLFLGVGALIQLFERYNALAGGYGYTLIPTTPVYWPVTAAYGLAFLYPAWKHRHRPFCLVAVGIICAGWICNTQLFFPIDGSASKGYELLSAVVLFITQAALLLLPLFTAKDEEDKLLITQMFILSIAMAVFGIGLSLFAQPVFLFTSTVETMKYYWWFFGWNMVFLAKLSATWTPIFETETRSKNSQPSIKYEKAA